jgi:hypothetical protein
VSTPTPTPTPTVWQTVSYDLKREDQFQISLADDGTVTEQVQLYYIAVTDQTSRGTTVEAAKASAGATAVPAIGDTLVLGGGSFSVRSVQPRRNGPYSFEVQVQAQSKYTPAKTGKWNVTTRFSGQAYTQDAHYDMNHKAVVNSAGQAFDPTVTETYYDERIEVSYTTNVDQSAVFAGVRGKVNGSALSFNIQGCSRSFGKRQLKCEDVQQTQAAAAQDGTPVYNVTASLTSRTDGYSTVVLDQGLYRINTGSNGSSGSASITPIKDSTGTANVTSPVLLDGHGQPLAMPTDVTTDYSGGDDDEGDDGDDGDAGDLYATAHTPNVTPHWMVFELEYEADLSVVFTGLS